VAGHGSGVAEAEVGVAVAVDVEEVRSLRLANEWREGAGPFHHPVHGHAGQQRLARALEQHLRLRALIDKLLLLTLHQGLQAGSIDRFHVYGKLTTGGTEDH
jgi:hypothetical protein